MRVKLRNDFCLKLNDHLVLACYVISVNLLNVIGFMVPIV